MDHSNRPARASTIRAVGVYFDSHTRRSIEGGHAHERNRGSTVLSPSTRSNHDLWNGNVSTRERCSYSNLKRLV